MKAEMPPASPDFAIAAAFPISKRGGNGFEPDEFRPPDFALSGAFLIFAKAASTAGIQMITGKHDLIIDMEY